MLWVRPAERPVALSDAASAAEWVNAAAVHDGFDILYNNASSPRFGSIDELSVDDWDFVSQRAETSSSTPRTPHRRV